MDRLDWAAVAGTTLLVAAAARLEGVLVATLFAGFLLSLSVWRLYDGRPWESLAWATWVAAAVVAIVAPGGAAFVAAFLGLVLCGLCLLFGARAGLLPPVWTVEESES